MKTMQRGERGFTLLELMMVVIIIAILAAIALPQFVRTTERARTGQVIELLGAIRRAETSFLAGQGNGNYTANLAQLDIVVPAPPAGWNAPQVTIGAAGDVCIQRAGGGAAVNNALLMIDLPSGNVCASTAAAAGEWGVNQAGGAACGAC